jgi:peroxiredoxin
VEGSWRKTFGIHEGPALLIVNPTGHTVWRQLGRISPENLTSSLNEHLQPGGRIRQRQLRVAAQIGMPAPDFLFEYARVRGRERSDERWMALHDLRGREVILAFWTVWSKPSLEELRHLQEINDSSRPVILAINDGDEEEHALNVFAKNGFTHQLVLDQERQISRRYAINCWPTTLAIDSVGRVASIHFGVTPGEGQFRDRAVHPRD